MTTELIYSLMGSIVLPLIPQAMALILLRKAWEAKPHHNGLAILAMCAAGMVQVLSCLWLLKSVTKVLAVMSEGEGHHQLAWLMYTLNSGPYLAVSLTLLPFIFWLIFLYVERPAKR